MIKKFLRTIRGNFIAGVLVILPVILTVAIIRFFIIKLNVALLTPLLSYLGNYLPEEEPRVILAKTLIFIVVICVITLIGLMTRIFFIRRTFSFLESFLFRLPMVNKVYGTIKQISSAFLGKRKGVFKRVILIEYPRKGIYSIAFVTSELSNEPSSKIGKELVSAYVPTTPNPTSGMFLLIPREEITALDMKVEEGLKMVISSGVIFRRSAQKP